MPEPPLSTYRKILNVLGDLRVIAWAIACLLFIVGGIYWLPPTIITFLLGMVVAFGLVGTIVYLTLTNERPIESIGDEVKRLAGGEETQNRRSLDRPKSVAQTVATPAPTDDSAQFKVIPEIGLEPYRSKTNRTISPGICLMYDALDTSSTDHKLFFASKLRIRFDNQDTSLAAIRRVMVFLRRESDAGEVRETQMGAALIRDVATRAKLDLDNFQIQPVAITPYYELDCDAELAKDWARLLDDHCFVRVKVEAVRQPPYCIDLNVDWETARLTDSVADVGLRRSGVCQEAKRQAEEPPLKDTELDKLEIKLLQILSWPKYEHDVEGLAGYVGQHVTRVEYHLERLEHDGYVCSSPVIIAGMKTTYSLTHKGREYVVKNKLLMV